jgi:hypothetical protein
MHLALIPREPPTRRADLRKISPALYRTDGTAFVVLFFAGQTAFLSDYLGDQGLPIVDPIFVAQRISDEEMGTYVPDHEVTALGCVERFRFCHKSQGCSHWFGNVDDDWSSEEDGRYNILPLGGNDTWWGTNTSLPKEFLALFIHYFRKSSIPRYLKLNPRFIFAQSRVLGPIRIVNRETQWHDEVLAWFDVAFRYAREDLFAKVVRERTLPETRQGKVLWDDKKFCGSFLFHDGEYTNFNVFWMILALVPVSLPVVWNYWDALTFLGTQMWSLYRIFFKILMRSVTYLFQMHRYSTTILFGLGIFTSTFWTELSRHAGLSA